MEECKNAVLGAAREQEIVEGVLASKMVIMNAEFAAQRFMEKLRGNGFTMARSQNTEVDYTDAKQKRDSRAVADFVETDLFQDILKLR